ncbi:chromosomal replication initiator protein DnaA [Ferrovibrio sp.]|uniref:chromosomal replication initiator protein DnaA n=1 Tax=Ferrovibrio sp. TaxID=1917215 RepID=UPI0025BD3033|nr:chromosomal replication initiator protein DnaA [Ferrovibrio sp.]MBX3456570.1 chromosomal replication initiator protein DnaA [Ferrovibrio sp.]
MVKSFPSQPQSAATPQATVGTETGIPSASAHLLAEQWLRVRGRLRGAFGEAAFNSWLKPLALAKLALEDGDVHLSVPTRFMRDWVANHYSERLREIWRLENPDVRRVLIQVRVAAAPKPGQAQDAAAADQRNAALRNADPHQPDQRATDPRMPGQQFAAAGQRAAEPRTDARTGVPLPARDMDDVERELSAPLDPRFTFESFVTGKSNELARAAALRVAESPQVAYNPLFLYGGVGLGKTHLMHAIGWHIRQLFPERRVVYLSAEKFMYQFIRALRFKDTMAFKEQFRSVDVLMIDDIQFIAGKESTQEEFFHTFNALCDQNRQIIVSGDRSPSDLEGIEERMRSRLGWGLVVDIHPTDFELRLSILQAKAERTGMRNIPAEVLEFLARRITSNIRELEGALNRISAYSSLVGRPITITSAQEVLADLLRANDRKVTIEEIQKRVAEHFSIRFADMHSPRRARAVARPRQVAMYLAKQLTSRSLPEIGRKFGGRDHTTVMHAVRKIEELRELDSAFAEDVDLLRRKLEG